MKKPKVSLALDNKGGLLIESAGASARPWKVDRGCPVCGAPPGEWCTTPAGKMRADHKKREYVEAETLEAQGSRIDSGALPQHRGSKP